MINIVCVKNSLSYFTSMLDDAKRGGKDKPLEEVDDTFEYYCSAGEKPREKLERAVDFYNEESFSWLFEKVKAKDILSKIKIAESALCGNKRKGYDITYTPGKSVSIGKYILEDGRISEAYKEAINTLVKEVQERIYTRRREGEMRYRERAEGFLIAFHHDLSREKDPNLHTHLFLFNKCLRGDGRVSAVTPEALYNDKTLLDLITSYQLGYSLQRKGIAIQWEKDTVEIKGIDKVIRDVFSKRRDEIIKKAKELGVNPDQMTKSFRDFVAVSTRKKKDKDHIELSEELYKWWEEQIKEAGWSIERIKQEYEKANKEWAKSRKIEVSKEEVKEMIYKVIEDMHEQESVVSETEIKKEVIKRIMKRVNEEGIKLKGWEKLKQEIEEGLQELQREGKLKQRRFSVNAVEMNFYFTDRQERIEKDFLHKAIYLNKLYYIYAPSSRVVGNEIIEFEKEKGFQLKEEQKEMVRLICSKKGRIVVVEGDAGAGKTTAMQVVAKICNKEGVGLIGLAPTGKAAEELSDSVGNAQTIDSFLLHWEKGEVDEESLRGSIFIVDEAGMVGVRKALKLVRIAENLEAKIVFVGDTKQFQSIESGAILRDLKTAGVNYHRLCDIRRQKDSEYLYITKALSAKDFKTAFSKITELNMIKDFDTPQDAMQSIINNFDNDTIIVASKNTEKDEINKKIREKLGMEDEIRFYSIQKRNISKKDKVHAEKYEVGDIISVKTGKGERVEYEVMEVREERNTLIVKDRETGIKKEINMLEWGEKVKEVWREKELGLSIGDRVVTLKNSSNLGVKNGELWEVVEIDNKRGIVVLQNEKKRVDINLKTYNFLDHAYCITTYKSQGMTVDKVAFFCCDHTSYNQFYVAVTRGKTKCEIYTTDAVNMLYTAQKSDEKHTTLSKAQDEKFKLNRDEIAKLVIKDLKSFEKYKKYIDSLYERERIKKQLTKPQEQKKRKFEFVEEKIQRIKKQKGEKERLERLTEKLLQGKKELEEKQRRRRRRGLGLSL